jgi:hypothetical protein
MEVNVVTKSTEVVDATLWLLTQCDIVVNKERADPSSARFLFYA